eukprot:g5388.t1
MQQPQGQVFSHETPATAFQAVPAAAAPATPQVAAAVAPPVPARPSKAICEKAALAKWEEVLNIYKRGSVKGETFAGLYIFAMMCALKTLEARSACEQLPQRYAQLMRLIVNLESLRKQRKVAVQEDIDTMLDLRREVRKTDVVERDEFGWKWHVLRLSLAYLNGWAQVCTQAHIHDEMLAMEASSPTLGGHAASAPLNKGCPPGKSWFRMLTLLHASRTYMNIGDIHSASLLTKEARLSVGSGAVGATRIAFCDMNEGIELAMGGKYVDAVATFQRIRDFALPVVSGFLSGKGSESETKAEVPSASSPFACGSPADLSLSSAASLLVLLATNNLAVCALQCGDIFKGIQAIEELLQTDARFALDEQMRKTQETLYALAYEPGSAKEKQRAVQALV